MPNFYAHLLYGREVCRRMQPAIQRALLRQWDTFCCGNFGPDPLYSYVGGRQAGAVRQAGIRLHHGSGADAMELFRQPVKTGKPNAAAFAAGYLLHYVLDSRMHPFVLKTVEAGQVTHFALEGEFDRYLLRRDGRAYPDAMPERPVTKELLQAAAYMAPELTPEQYRVALKRFRMISCRIGSWAGTPMRHVVNAASHLPPVRKIRGSVLEQEPSGVLVEYLTQMDRIFAAAIPEGAELLAEFFRCVEQDLPMPAGLGTDYSGNEVATDGVH